MNELIQKLKSISDLNLEATNSFWIAQISNFYRYYFEIQTPKDVNEWFVTLISSETNEEIWSDWVDWYLSGDINKI